MYIVRGCDISCVLTGDMLKLQECFMPASFDVVIDKAAMDALMVQHYIYIYIYHDIHYMYR